MGKDRFVVLFDLDGTLLYTLEDLKNSVNFVLQKYNYPQRSLDEIALLWVTASEFLWNMLSLMVPKTPSLKNF